jgi:hypothetical protein
MRNNFGGTCYRCQKWVEPGDGHFERFRGGWRVQHAICAIECRGTPDPEREADTLARRQRLSKGTGRTAQRARKRLRDEGLL